MSNFLSERSQTSINVAIQLWKSFKEDQLAAGRQGESSWHWESSAGGNGSGPCWAPKAAVAGTHDPAFTGTPSRVGLLRVKQQCVSRMPWTPLLCGRGRAQPMTTVGHHPCFSLSWPRALLRRGRKDVLSVGKIEIAIAPHGQYLHYLHLWSPVSDVNTAHLQLPWHSGKGGAVAWGKVSWFFSWGPQFTIYCHFHQDQQIPWNMKSWARGSQQDIPITRAVSEPPLCLFWSQYTL